MIKYQLVILALFIFFTACQESSSIGNNLLDDEKFNIQFKDDFSISSSTDEGNRVIAYQSSVGLNLYTVGKIDDPIFGESTKEVFFNLGFNPFISIPDFNTAILDSMVLVMTYDTVGDYGNKDAIHNLELYALNQDFDDLDTIYAEETISFESELIGTKSFVSAPNDSISILNHTDTTLLKLPPQIRVRLDQDWANTLFEDETFYADADALETYFTGLYIKNTPSTSSLLGLDLSSVANGESGRNRMIVYYTDTSNIKKVYTFRIGSKRGTLVQENKGSSLAQQIEDGSVTGDSLSLIGAHSIQNTKVTFNDLSFLSDKIINHAVIRVFVASLPEDNLALYDPIGQILASSFSDEGNLEIISDISDLSNRNISLVDGFGGNLMTENGVSFYEMNITKRIKDIVELGLTPDESNIILTPLSRNQIPNRTVLYGSTHSQYPIEFEVTYTLK